MPDFAMKRGTTPTLACQFRDGNGNLVALSNVASVSFRLFRTPGTPLIDKAATFTSDVNGKAILSVTFAAADTAALSLGTYAAVFIVTDLGGGTQQLPLPPASAPERFLTVLIDAAG